MPLTGSEKDLENKLFDVRSKNADLTVGDTKTRLRASCKADAEAIVAWILDNGNASVQGSTILTVGKGLGAPGVSVVGAGGSIPGPTSGATVAPVDVTLTQTNSDIVPATIKLV